jgi:two-component system sensor histidine kinase CpxA
MKIAFPLSFKVSLWLLLNLLLLAVLGTVLFLTQIGWAWESFIAGPACDRLQAVAGVMAGELELDPNRDRTELLENLSSTYGVELHLIDVDGVTIEGKPLVLPEETKARLAPPPLPLLRPPIPAGLHPERGRPEHERDLHEPARGPTNRPRHPPGERRRFLQHTSSPARYWVGVPMIYPRTVAPPQSPVFLLAVTPSLFRSSLLFDLKPWLIAGGGAAIFSVLFWIPLVRGVTGAVAHLETATTQIAAGRLNTRVSLTRRDELGQLGQSINTMAERLEGFVYGQKRFLGDVAHELSSPLARLQLSTSILEERAGTALASAIADVREEVELMSTLVNELLVFTRTELAQPERPLEAIALLPLVLKVIEREATAGQVTVNIPSNLSVLADPGLLHRALGNLVRNAVRYAAGQGPITIAATRTGEWIVVRVEDEGPGVPAEAVSRLGEAFFRPESARTRESGGVGLGLAIVKNAVTTCRGTVRFSNRTPKGFVTEIQLHGAKPIAVP